MADAPGTARALWALFEPVHAVTYFAPEALSAFADAGLRGFWRGYFAGRAAALGTVGPEPVTAAFFGFAPAMVARALPEVWSAVTPGAALAARQAGARAALTRLLSGRERQTAEAADLLLERVRGLDCAGRVLAAAHHGLDAPPGPAGRLWHAATVLREHRGDGHVAALVAAGLDGCESLVLRTGIDLPRHELQPFRGWSDAQWQAAVDRLAGRGLLDAAGTATPKGRLLHRRVEEATDRAAARPWQEWDAGAPERLRRLLAPLAGSCAAALRFPNPMGLPAPRE
ncbi:hypothetical protein V1J52_01860 [Streptomyces sp. TRM 70351]|uniref:SCO6745 family protein n=1 Tax=Streptomyces sp. TRM 70351 TaxID=3116552 RepID=UPI002E7AE378|nr:hypothetical protein [Streptomyces sp. TRM 70351]MEE1926940.1 hypothetical protein [Streptomyces sp. TRM 70351]